MKVFILLSVVAGAFAFLDCPANQHYESCGTACPLTCDNYNDPPKACVLMCNPGCHCDEGYIKTENGECVLPENCPNRANEVCGENERFLGCGTACPLTCDNYQNPPKFCTLQCVIGCACEDGYVKASDGRCVLPENCPSRANAEEESCVAEPDSGICKGYFPMFYYDVPSGTCKIFVYGGCQGNGNRYESEEECLANCGNNVCGENEKYTSCGTACPLTCDNYQNPPIACTKQCVIGCQCAKGYVKTADGRCVLPENCPATAIQSALDRPDCDKAPEVGVCRARIPRFYYDQQAGMCKTFIYGGCGGNRNNFESEFDCLNKCGALALSSNAICEQEKVVGPCEAAFRRYYFNKQTGKCEKFIYGGCMGNDNNFVSKAACESTCVA